MKTIICLVSIVLTLFVTSITKDITSKKIECYDIIETFPHFPSYDKQRNKWNYSGYDTSIGRVYTFGNYKLFRFYFQFTGIVNNKGQIVTPKKYYYYLLHKNDDKFAYCFDKKRNLFNVKVNADSAMQQDWLINANSDDMFNTEEFEVKKMGEKRSSNRDNLEIRYQISRKIDTSEKATCILSYTNKFSSHFKLTKKLDTIIGMQLYKVKTIYHERYLKDKRTNNGEFEIFQELKKVESFDDKEILNIFNTHI